MPAGVGSYDRIVAYDEELAERIRELLYDERGITEQKMFGGLAFLIGGNMAVAASGQGGVLVRVDPELTPTSQCDARRAQFPRFFKRRCIQGVMRAMMRHTKMLERFNRQ